MAKRERVRKIGKQTRPRISCSVAELALPHRLSLSYLLLYRFQVILGPCTCLLRRHPLSLFLNLTLADVHYFHHVCEYSCFPSPLHRFVVCVGLAYRSHLQDSSSYGLLTSTCLLSNRRDTRPVSDAVSLEPGIEVLNLRLLSWLQQVRLRLDRRNRCFAKLVLGELQRSPLCR